MHIFFILFFWITVWFHSFTSLSMHIIISLKVINFARSAHIAQQVNHLALNQKVMGFWHGLWLQWSSTIVYPPQKGTKKETNDQNIHEQQLLLHKKKTQRLGKVYQIISFNGMIQYLWSSQYWLSHLEGFVSRLLKTYNVWPVNRGDIINTLF